jgi:hypothetical protein
VCVCVCVYIYNISICKPSSDCSSISAVTPKVKYLYYSSRPHVVLHSTKNILSSGKNFNHPQFLGSILNAVIVTPTTVVRTATMLQLLVAII